MHSFNYNLHELSLVAEQIIKANESQKIWAFYGQMGIGKTTLIKAICKQLGVIDLVSSPTFSLVNEYKTQTNNTIYHFDFYRIKSINEVYDMGYEMYFDSGNLCLIEWPEQIESILEKEEFVKINITLNPDNESRTFEIEG